LVGPKIVYLLNCRYTTPDTKHRFQTDMDTDPDADTSPITGIGVKRVFVWLLRVIYACI
jgi:hypothetical protein